MDARGYQQYKEQSINTMTQGELLLLLYDELVKRATRAELALDKQDYPLFEASIDRCLEIIRYLDDTLDRKELQRVKPMLADLRDTFRTASKQAGNER